MRSIQSFQDLEEFGVVALTGESCGYAMRLLCDVTAQGKNLLEEFWGRNVEIKEGTQYNAGKQENPHVGSVMLPREGFIGPFGAFCLLRTRTSAQSMIVSVKGNCENHSVEFEAEDMKRISQRWAHEDDSVLRVGDMIWWDSGTDCRFLEIETVETQGDSVTITDERGKVLSCPRSQITKPADCVFNEKFERHAFVKVARYYAKPCESLEERHVHQFSGRTH